MEKRIEIIAKEGGDRIDALLAREEAIRSRNAAVRLLEAVSYTHLTLPTMAVV